MDEASERSDGAHDGLGSVADRVRLAQVVADRLHAEAPAADELSNPDDGVE